MGTEERIDFPRGCYQCNNDIRNPYSIVRLAVRGQRGHMAFSGKILNLCAVELGKVSESLLDNPDRMGSDIGYVVSTVTGICNERGGPVQVFSDFDIHGNYRFLNMDVVREKFPEAAKDLERSYSVAGQCFRWTEKKGDDWEEVTWPQEIFMREICKYS